MMWTGPCTCQLCEWFPELPSKHLLEAATLGCKKQLGTVFLVENTASKKIAEYFLSLHYHLLQITASCSFFEVNSIGRKHSEIEHHIEFDFQMLKIYPKKKSAGILLQGEISFSLDPLKQKGVLSAEENQALLEVLSQLSVFCSKPIK